MWVHVLNLSIHKDKAETIGAHMKRRDYLVNARLYILFNPFTKTSNIPQQASYNSEVHYVYPITFVARVRGGSQEDIEHYIGAGSLIDDWI